MQKKTKGLDRVKAMLTFADVDRWLREKEEAAGNPQERFRDFMEHDGYRYNADVVYQESSRTYFANISWTGPKFGDMGGDGWTFDTEEKARAFIAKRFQDFKN